MRRPTKPITSIKGMKLASRGERFWAALIDGTLPMPILLSSVFYKNGYDLPAYADYGLAGYVLCLGIIQAFLITQSGQSIGKRIRKLRIVRIKDGKTAGFITGVLKRYIILFLISFIPFLGILISFLDATLIFGRHKRCLHDFIAGTHVVKIKK